jgi:hypothetical protein
MNVSSQILAIFEGCIKFFEYMLVQWCNNLIHSWTEGARIHAAKILNVNRSFIPTTNNHLESFNSHLKDSYLHEFQRNKAQLRVDTLIMCLVKFITPNLIRRRKLQLQLDSEIKQRNSHLDLNNNKQENIHLIKSNYQKLVYMEDDENRDLAAKRIFSMKGIEKYEYTSTGLFVWVKSESQSSKVYVVYLDPLSKAGCQCIDFLFQGGACKHI